MRLFVAIYLPGNIRSRLASLERGIPGARWVPSDNLHITLAFAGEVGVPLVADIEERLSEVRFHPFEFAIRGVGYFGSLRNVRAVWAGVDVSENMNRLQKRVRRAFELAGVRFDRRRFRPHVTLARVRGETGHHLANFLSEHSLLNITGIEVRDIVLFESQLSSDGATYIPLSRYRLEQSVHE